MSEKYYCEKCGAEMIPIDSNVPVGMVCRECGWGWATTYTDPVLDDDTVYSVTLLGGNSSSQKKIKAVAQITNQNYLQAKHLIENAPALLFSGKALQVRDVIRLLSDNQLSYSIDPEFLFPLN